MRTSDAEILISFHLSIRCYECWLNVIWTQYCISDINELTSLSTRAALNYATSRPDSQLTQCCNSALDPNYLSAHDAVSPSVTSPVFVQNRHTRFSTFHCTNSIYWSPKITVIYYVDIWRNALHSVLYPAGSHYPCTGSRTCLRRTPHVCTTSIHRRIQSSPYSTPVFTPFLP
jgi:hypothetical protein